MYSEQLILLKRIHFTKSKLKRLNGFRHDLISEFYRFTANKMNSSTAKSNFITKATVATFISIISIRLNYHA